MGNTGSSSNTNTSSKTKDIQSGGADLQNIIQNLVRNTHSSDTNPTDTIGTIGFSKSMDSDMSSELDLGSVLELRQNGGGRDTHDILRVKPTRMRYEPTGASRQLGGQNTDGLNLSATSPQIISFGN